MSDNAADVSVRYFVGADCILTQYVPFYPAYRKGDEIFLEIHNEIAKHDSMKLTRFIIVSVSHSVNKVYLPGNVFSRNQVDVVLRKPKPVTKADE